MNRREASLDHVDNHALRSHLLDAPRYSKANPKIEHPFEVRKGARGKDESARRLRWRRWRLISAGKRAVQYD